MQQINAFPLSFRGAVVSCILEHGIPSKLHCKNESWLLLGFKPGALVSYLGALGLIPSEFQPFSTFSSFVSY